MKDEKSNPVDQPESGIPARDALATIALVISRRIGRQI